ncbi:hypothetical protein [Actinomadura roseirufa]|uniref:hypothetical protein n=1 Tax=Actinomadura roseirufa TaxID=2094049 RepID=UPI0010412354|nr:hypothetical protein [Actinomadura roseirufa]
MAGTRRAPRARSITAGMLLVVLGLWGGSLPFAGPYLDFGFAPDDPWVFDTGRLQLSIAPAAATVLGGLVVLAGGRRAVVAAGAALAVLGGAWFTVGGPVAALWDVHGVGDPLGAQEGRRVAEQLSGFTALGVVIVFLGALALGRATGAGAREAEASGEPPEGDHKTTQPLVYGRYARQNTPPGPVPRPAPPFPGDRPVAGERGRPDL